MTTLRSEHFDDNDYNVEKDKQAYYIKKNDQRLWISKSSAKMLLDLDLSEYILRIINYLGAMRWL